MRRWLILAAAIVALSSTALWISRRADSGAGLPGPAPGGGDRLFDAVLTRIRASSVDSLDDEELYQRAAQGLVDELDDPYAYLRFARESDPPPADEPWPQGIFLDRRDGLVAVVGVVPGGPADSAGVRAGDLLLGIDSVSLTASRLPRVAALLAGKPGSPVTLRVMRGTRAGAPVSLGLRRGPVPHGPGLSATVLGGGVGRIRLLRFDGGSAAAVGRALAQLRQQGVRSLVLDFRGTVQGGSDLAAGAAVADLFLEPGAPLVSSRMRRASGTVGLTDSTSSPFGDMPLAVLIDSGTAGAGEVVAGALQDHDRAVILGTPSYGRGVTQSSFRLSESGAVLTLTTALWLTPSGRQIQRPPRLENGDSLPRPRVRSDAGRSLVGGGGIVPDRVVSGTGAGEADPVLAEAQGILMRAGSPAKVFAQLPPAAPSAPR